MTQLILYRASACLLALAALGHTLGGLLGTARRGPQAGAQAEEVFALMKAVHFTWRGSESTWFGFWLGNGLSVSALLLLAIVVLWILGGLGPSQRQAMLPIAWAAFVSLGLLAFFGFKYFAPAIGGGFSLIALLTGMAAMLSTLAATS